MPRPPRVMRGPTTSAACSLPCQFLMPRPPRVMRGPTTSAACSLIVANVCKAMWRRRTETTGARPSAATCTVCKLLPGCMLRDAASRPIGRDQITGSGRWFSGRGQDAGRNARCPDDLCTVRGCKRRDPGVVEGAALAERHRVRRPEHIVRNRTACPGRQWPSAQSTCRRGLAQTGGRKRGAGGLRRPWTNDSGRCPRQRRSAHGRMVR